MMLSNVWQCFQNQDFLLGVAVGVGGVALLALAWFAGKQYARLDKRRDDHRR